MNASSPALIRFNRLSERDAVAEMRRCCGSDRWCESMVASRPLASASALMETSESAFANLTEGDWLQAFAHHPQIGDLQSLQMKYGGNREWSAGEQRGADRADLQTLQELADGNARYERQFGFNFIVCATGKSATEMLSILNRRFANSRRQELQQASVEQQQITGLRLQKWLASFDKEIR